jgi:hypothetical protein
MDLKLPNKAGEYFNKKAEEFLFLLKPEPAKERRGKVKSSSTEQFSYKFNENDIISIGIIMEVDGFGNEKARYFNVDKTRIGLSGEDYASFENLTQQIVKKKEFDSLLSQKFLKDTLFEWFEKKYTGSLHSSANFITYLSKQSEDAVKSRKISIPLSFIEIQDPFVVGKVIFEYFRKELFDQIEEHLLKNFENREEDVANKMISTRKQYQGSVVATMTVKAEKHKCLEIVKEETEKAIMILRFFSPGTFLPKIPCYLGRMGQVNIPSNHFFLFDDKQLPNIIVEVDEKKDFDFFIGKQQLSMLKGIGIEEASNVILKERKTELEDLLLNCMELFTKGIASKEYQDKIVFSLVAVETLLLQNTSEPIQSNVSLRLAFLTENFPEGRKNVVTLVKKAYKLRSAYLHHGKFDYDYKILQELQHTVWTALRNVLMNRSRFMSQAELLDFIEKQVLT